MHKLTKLRLKDLEEHVTCSLCHGYLIDALTITECVHSFCRSCLLHRLQQKQYQCPRYISNTLADVSGASSEDGTTSEDVPDGSTAAASELLQCPTVLQEGKLQSQLRSDKVLQNCVYKLVPGLFNREMDQRRRFYKDNPPADAASLSPEKRGEVSAHHAEAAQAAAALVRCDERISLSLEFVDCGQLRDHTLRPEALLLDRSRTCYLLCPASFTIKQLLKLLRLKLDLSSHLELCIFYTDDVLLSEYTLMDVANVYSWMRKAPLRLFYTVLDSSMEVDMQVVYQNIKPDQLMRAGDAAATAVSEDEDDDDDDMDDEDDQDDEDEDDDVEEKSKTVVNAVATASVIS